MEKSRDWEAWAAEFLAPWNAHDVEGVLATLPEGFTWQFPAGTEAHGTTYSGHEELREWLTRFFKIVPDLHYAVVALHPGTRHLVMEVLVTGRNVDTGQDLNFQACDIVLFDGDTPIGKRSYRKVVSSG